MAHFFFDESATTQKIYMDRQFFSKFEDQVAALRGSKIVYVGNLSFYTSEAQIIASFQRAGPVRRVIMGLNRHTRTPCGFCFVEYFTNEAALDCIAHVSGTTLDDRVIRCELDFGFREGRQFGRGASGGQVRDDRRVTYDPARDARGHGTRAGPCHRHRPFVTMTFDSKSKKTAEQKDLGPIRQSPGPFPVGRTTSGTAA